MYLSSLSIKNFRCFDENEHIIKFNKGLTVLVGENDAGKSAIIDAIKIVMGTTDMVWYRICSEDYYNEDMSREISIICRFDGLSEQECAAFLECLSYDNDNNPCLYYHWKCRCLTSYNPPRQVSTTTTGKNGAGPSISPESKELLRVTYLRALRDAHSDLQAGRHSRLAQIMQHVSNSDIGIDEYNDEINVDDLSIAGIVDLSNKLLANHKSVKHITEEMDEILSKQLLLSGDNIKIKFEVSDDDESVNQKKMSLLEKLDLTIDKDSSVMRGNFGLGTSNIMSMACEMLLHKEAETNQRSTFLLIEEPEAHIHAQRQLKLIQSLEEESQKDNKQIIITTHSPLLASVVKLENIAIIKSGQIYPLAPEYTELEKNDYWFLEKYLDATKANLFFARSVIIVEGPGEALLLPTIAKLIGCNFVDSGTSLVDVRSTGLRRYARIFQRNDTNEELNINVACITDKDIMPNCAPMICIDSKYKDMSSFPKIENRAWRVLSDYKDGELDDKIKEICERADGQRVKTFVADHWTLEYDLAFSALKDENYFKVLVEALIESSYVKERWKSKTDEFNDAIKAYNSPEEKASFFYSYFSKKNKSKADFAQMLSYKLEKMYCDDSSALKNNLPQYLVKAIEYAVKGVKS